MLWGVAGEVGDDWSTPLRPCLPGVANEKLLPFPDYPLLDCFAPVSFDLSILSPLLPFSSLTSQFYAHLSAPDDTHQMKADWTF